MAKILGLCCSPRKGGNTELLLNLALKGAEQEGAETELYRVAGKTIKPCDGCGSCRKEGKCHIQDDMQELYGKLLEADGIIFGAPSYFYGMAGAAKDIIDRTTALNQPGRNLANKVGAVIAVAASMGLADILKNIYFYMVTQQMVPAKFVAAYGLEKGDVGQLENGKKAANEMGQQMVRIAAMNFKYPPEFKASVFGYGTWNK